jgi:hypothetical protein
VEGRCRIGSIGASRVEYDIEHCQEVTRAKRERKWKVADVENVRTKGNKQSSEPVCGRLPFMVTEQIMHANFYFWNHVVRAKEQNLLATCLQTRRKYQNIRRAD